MDYITPDADNQFDSNQLDDESDQELAHPLPLRQYIPSALKAANQWVCWGYHQNTTGQIVRIKLTDSTSFDGAMRLAIQDHLGLAFMLTAQDPFAAIHIPNYASPTTGRIKDIPQKVMALVQGYVETDPVLNDMFIIAAADSASNIQAPDIAIYFEKQLIPITGAAEISDDIQNRTQAFDQVASRFCSPSWMERVSSRQGEAEEYTVLMETLDDCLTQGEAWLQDAHRTDLYTFLAHCWGYARLQAMVFNHARTHMMRRTEIDVLVQIIDETRKDLGLTKAKAKPAADTPANTDPETGDEWENDLQYDAKRSKVIENFCNMGMILEYHQHWQGRIRFDAFRNLPMLDEHPVSDTTEYRIAEWLGEQYAFGGNRRQTLSDAIKAVASKNTYDALLEWMDALPEWDGTPRIDTWMIDHCGAEASDYSKWVSRVTLIQMVNRALHPGCIARLIPIWNGPENQGKSTAVALLGGEWATTLKVSLENKEAHMAIHGYWIAELEELDTLYKTSEARLKAFLTNTSDHYVPKYANHSVNYPRRTVFIGTTNDSDYLRGLTGNTRFLPINTREFDLPGIERNREQLFAEAKAWLLDNPGEQWWQEPDGIREVIKEQRESRRIFNIYENDLEKFLDGDLGDNYVEQIGKRGPKTPKTARLNKTTLGDIFALYLKIEAKEKWADERLQRQIRDALKTFGWYPKKSNSTNWWMRPDETPEDEVPF